MAASAPDPAPDPFDVLGLPARFDLDPSAIRGAYLSRVSRLHPDAAGSDDEAARVNDARRVLEDPESRARALLGRLGGPTRARRTDVDQSALPEGFLMEVMEIREAMEAATDVSRFRALAAERRSAHIARIAGLFDEIAELDEAGGAPAPERLGELRDQIRMELSAWRYTERMIEQLQP